MPSDATQPLSLSLTVTPSADITILGGELDIFTSIKLRDYIYDRGLLSNPVVVIDLNGLDFMDSSGLAALVAAGRWLKFRNKRLVLVCAGGQPSKVLKAVRLDIVLPTISTIADLDGV